MFTAHTYNGKHRHTEKLLNCSLRHIDDRMCLHQDKCFIAYKQHSTEAITVIKAEN